MTGLADDVGEEFFRKERAREPSQRCEQARRARGVQAKTYMASAQLVRGEVRRGQREKQGADD